NGFSQFSSLAPGGISEFIGNLGIAATGNSYRYYDPTPLIDAMFDIRYVMNKDGEITKDRYVFEEQFDNVWVYRNDRALPLGFMVNSDIKDWQTEDSMPFDVQNDFVKLSTGTDKDMFTPIEPDSIDKTYMEVSEQLDDNSFKYTLTDPANLSLEPTVTATFTSDKDQYMYVYVDAGNTKRVKYQTNTANEDRELSAGKSLFDIGHVSAGEQITVSFSLTNKGEFEKTYRKDGTVKIYAASYDDEVFNEAYNKLNSNTFNITSFEDTRIEGTVNAESDGVMFTSIPYVDGWKVTVDGQSVDKVSIGNDGVIGIDIPSGEHTVVLQFKSKGLVPAIVISFIGLILAVVYTLADSILKKKIESKLVAAAAFDAEVSEAIAYKNSKGKNYKKNKRK
ncbi:MAG: YfhO family protein, partial [Clostridia bacterium]|nr:YfhO family protein [Clostridia bacterium]